MGFGFEIFSHPPASLCKPFLFFMQLISRLGAADRELITRVEE